MKRLEVEAFGPIRHADVTFGDLTVLVGPQATGKSLFAQLYKAIEDAGPIRDELRRYGFDWLHGADPTASYCSLYFGGGLQGLVTPKTALRRDGKALAFQGVVKPSGRAAKDETVFLIPAQRVLTLQTGWPQPFMAYSVGDPYSTRHFSDVLRLQMEQGLGASAPIFPHGRRLKAELKRLIDDAIYIGAKLELDVDGMQKRVVLTREGDGASLPFLAWSAGQREFTPLLLGLYWLLPSAKTARRGALETVIIEEPEMGLHPQAIVSFCLLMLELLARGYRVIVSTHSPVILDVVWALRELREVREKAALEALRTIFDLPITSEPVRALLETALQKDYRTYYFDRTADGVIAKDISSLDPGDDDLRISGWGGLSGFSGRLAEAVGAALTRESAT